MRKVLKLQIGITLIGILTGIYSGDKITESTQLFVEGFAVLKPYAHSIAVGIVVIIRQELEKRKSKLRPQFQRQCCVRKVLKL